MDAAAWDARYACADLVWSGTANPHVAAELAGLAANARIVHVIGTTGLSAADEAKIAAAARHAAIVKAGNMSLGVNLLAAIARRVAEALDDDGAHGRPGRGGTGDPDLPAHGRSRVLIARRSSIAA